MITTTQAIRTIIARLPPGQLVTAAGLERTVNKPVDRALSPVAKEMGLVKLRNGIYWKPKVSPIFQTAIVPIEGVEKALKEQYGALLHRSGQWAAHRYLLATEPEVATYDTDKRLSPLKVDDRCLEFRQVRKERLASAGREFGELLNAIEWWLEEPDSHHASTRYYIGLLLQEFTPHQRAHALGYRRPRVRDFCEAAAPARKPLRYITGWSALNVPQDNGDVADWHTEAIVRAGKLIVAGGNHPASPGLKPSDLRDIRSFINGRGLDWPTHLCASPERAVLDLVYHAIFNLRSDPGVDIDDLMVDIDRPQLRRHMQSWLQLASSDQQELLQEWMSANGIDERTEPSRNPDPAAMRIHP